MRHRARPRAPPRDAAFSTRKGAPKLIKPLRSEIRDPNLRERLRGGILQATTKVWRPYLPKSRTVALGAHLTSHKKCAATATTAHARRGRGARAAHARRGFGARAAHSVARLGARHTARHTARLSRDVGAPHDVAGHMRRFSGSRSSQAQSSTSIVYGVDSRDQYNKSERPEPEASPATRYVAPRQLARLNDGPTGTFSMSREKQNAQLIKMLNLLHTGVVVTFTVASLTHLAVGRLRRVCQPTGRHLGDIFFSTGDSRQRPT